MDRQKWKEIDRQILKEKEKQIDSQQFCADVSTSNWSPHN